jgi:hypothetical protein
MSLANMGCEGLEWIDLAQDREQRRAPVNAVMNLGEFFYWELVGFSRTLLHGVSC